MNKKVAKITSIILALAMIFSFGAMVVANFMR